MYHEGSSDFITSADGEHAIGWNELWLNHRSDLWDRGFPSPPLVELIAGNPQLLSYINDRQKRKRVLVPVSSGVFPDSDIY
jgi:hypothetical protein